MSGRYRKPWTDGELSTLRDLAGSNSTAQIAGQLGRGISATVAKAHKLGVSLRKRQELTFKGVVPNLDPGPCGMDFTSSSADDRFLRFGLTIAGTGIGFKRRRGT